jgi:hypothetical protein
MSREEQSAWATEEHRRQPLGSTPYHRRRAWAPINGVRIDGVHLERISAESRSAAGAKLGVAGKDGRLKMTGHHSGKGGVHRRHPLNR